jgi:hypothetical protein
MRAAIACAGLLAVAIAFAQGIGTEARRKWVDSFSAHKANIRALDPTATKACESQLHRILKAIDDNAVCSVDSECTLLDQDPFGNTVPVRVERAKALLADMKRFAYSCDNHSSRSVRDNGTVNVPGCVKNRCMVLTSLKR